MIDSGTLILHCDLLQTNTLI